MKNSFEEYMEYQLEEMMSDNWDVRIGNRQNRVQQNYGLPKLYIGNEAFDRVLIKTHHKSRSLKSLSSREKLYIYP